MTDLNSLFDTNARTPLVTSTAGSCRSPDEVLDHPYMGVAEKRALLASWASDANAVPDAPSLRQIEGSFLSVDEILRALKALDGDEKITPVRGSRSALSRASFDFRLASIRRRKSSSPRHPGPDDDDDPPPTPAYVALVPKGGGGAAGASLELMLA